jgi:hypothetical protein
LAVGPEVLISFVGSNAFLVVKPRDAVYPAGSRMEAILVGPPAIATGERE